MIIKIIKNILSVFLIIFLMSWGQFQIPLIFASSIQTKPISIVAI